MRHLYGFALALLLAAAVFFVASAAASGTPAGGGSLPAGGGSLFLNAHVMGGGGLLLAVGLAAGLLMVLPRVSPLAAGLPGLVLVAWTGLYVSDVREAVRLIPYKSQGFGQGFELLLFDGLLGMAGLAMIVPLFVPSRWRRAPRVPGYPALGVSAPGNHAAVSPVTGSPDLEGSVVGFTAPSGGESSVIIDRTRTYPQHAPVIPPDGSPAADGLPDQG